jgi:hypothetical protein
MARFNETADEKKARLKEKFEVTLTAQEVFALTCALERFIDIDDSEFAKITGIAGKIKLPKVDVVWDDVASYSRR